MDDTNKDLYEKLAVLSERTSVIEERVNEVITNHLAHINTKLDAVSRDVGAIKTAITLMKNDSKWEKWVNRAMIAIVVFAADWAFKLLPWFK